MRAVADTSFVVALADQNDPYHQRCQTIYEQARVIYLPQTTLAEVGYLLRRAGGNRMIARFLRLMPHRKYILHALDENDLERTAQILDQYADSRVDFVDATVAAIAENRRITRILTLDRRDFSIIRPNHIPHFEILPTGSG
ncbi:MAG: PIN domain-containing protein [Anaerolineae bacterium]|nr:PIN domain-containing protein [Anaerolineae bacterium]